VTTYNVNINFVEYYGIISAFPKNWKQINLVDAIILDRICNEIVEKRKAEKNLVNIFTIKKIINKYMKASIPIFLYE
jgi:hypothetical protein